MGCSMYMHVEVRDSPQRKANWNYIPGEYYSGRNTTIYALLAGVRNFEGIEPLDDPRGLPRDVTRKTWGAYHDALDDVRRPEDHITSWFTLDELEQVDWERFVGVWHETDFSVGTMAKLRELAERHSEVRIVFWFSDTIVDLVRHEQFPYTFTARG